MLFVVFVLLKVLQRLIYNYRPYYSNYQCYHGLLFTGEQSAEKVSRSHHNQFLDIVGDGVLRASNLRRYLAAHHLLTGLFGKFIIIIIIIIVVVVVVVVVAAAAAAVIIVVAIIRLLCCGVDESS
jgi:hypothetical protein